jgi:hypothetical protein
VLGLAVTASRSSRSSGRPAASSPTEFFHYAQNFSIPHDGEYTLRASIEPPALLRHGEQGDGPELSQGATVRFEDVLLEGTEGS